MATQASDRQCLHVVCFSSFFHLQGSQSALSDTTNTQYTVLPVKDLYLQEREAEERNFRHSGRYIVLLYRQPGWSSKTLEAALESPYPSR